MAQTHELPERPEAMMATELLSKWRRWVSQHGPDRSEFEQMTNFWHEVHVGLLARWLKTTHLDEMWSIFGQEAMDCTLQGFVRRHPHGYYGDFEIIDKIYQYWICPDPRYRKWDDYFQAQAAPRAVRNGKAYFVEVVRQLQPNGHARVLNLASGPCRDVLEAMDIRQETISFLCVDIDEKAHQYASNLLRGQHNIELLPANVFRLRPKQSFDLVWSGGLFDYFTDQQFVFMLQRAATWVAQNGQIIVENFSPSNPTRAYMETCGGWFLHHRTRDQLISLGVEAGFAPDQMTVDAEPEGVNLFLRIQN